MAKKSNPAPSKKVTKPDPPPSPPKKTVMTFDELEGPTLNEVAGAAEAEIIEGPDPIPQCPRCGLLRFPYPVKIGDAITCPNCSWAGVL
jgi:predicted RNA-binding Zn-ribbon protein involved in translation (DUF1610 family)